MVTDDFYRALEDRFRGSRDLIKARQSVYLPVVEALLQRVPKKIIDIGCGRAEWLELLGARGLSAEGLDLNDEFVAKGQQAGLSVIKGDATDYLGLQPDQSYTLVSAFHVVEHLGFEKLLTFMKEAHRVLDDGGAMLLETPNPANLVVGACNFYLDPTHERPIPSILLSFAAEFSGFERVVVVPVNRDFLQNDLELLPSELSGASVVNKVVSALDQNFMQAPDYAIIAFKKADNESIPIAESLVTPSALPISQKETEDVNALFARVLEAEKERAALQGKAELAAAEAAYLKERAARNEERLREVRLRAEADLRASKEQAAARASELEAQLHQAQSRAVAAEDVAHRAQHHVAAMMASTSWRLSSPLRAGGLTVRKIGRSKAAVNRLARLGLLHAAAYVRCRPVLRQRIANVLSRMPRVRAGLIKMAGFDAIQGVVTGAAMPAVESIDRLTARGRKVHADLLSALNARTK
ncbi:Methyltransferase domain protein [Caballeronia sp. SBC1]|uniref:class I SAM-dependent methyltransferase n=1 Tax=unclassified Caballeronia TaxID=2646786 RepID=UPI0013E140E3|nr:MULTISPECIES: class I SAM-dependent methyltransferase [unclassified Caballeronia]QIE24856.1 Methyltransferase domain protein [Caballeronia sp. SBC2]QIN62876.1 Methyltransferase domain protein [Caballeronia sp. SBC1]